MANSAATAAVSVADRPPERELRDRERKVIDDLERSITASRKFSSHKSIIDVLFNAWSRLARRAPLNSADSSHPKVKTHIKSGASVTWAS